LDWPAALAENVLLPAVAVMVLPEPLMVVAPVALPTPVALAVVVFRLSAVEAETLYVVGPGTVIEPATTASAAIATRGAQTSIAITTAAAIGSMFPIFILFLPFPSHASLMIEV
jgi:hypothetical protein